MPDTQTTDTQKLAIYDVLNANLNQPLISLEIAHATGIEKTSVRRLLNEMVADNVVARRRETVEERTLRFGATPRAVAGWLYAVVEPVPARTVREVVPGYVAVTTFTGPRLSGKELRLRLAKTLFSKPASFEFTGRKLAECARVKPDSIHNYIRSWVENGWIVSTNGKSRNTTYRVVNHTPLLESLGLDVNQPQLPTPEPEPRRRRAKKQAEPAPAESTEPEGEFVPLAEVEVLLQENEELRARVAELEAQQAPARRLVTLDELRARRTQ